MSILIQGACMFQWGINLLEGTCQLLALPLHNAEDSLSPDLNAFISETAKKMGIKKKKITVKVLRDIQTPSITNPLCFSACGTSLLPGKAGLTLSADALDKNKCSERELEFFLSHEIAHIAANDMFWSFVPTIAGIAIATLCPVSVFLSYPLGVIVSGIANIYIHRWREEQADITASKHTNTEQKEAALKAFETFKEIFSNPNNLTPQQQKEYFAHSIVYPSFEQRINNVRSFL